MAHRRLQWLAVLFASATTLAAPARAETAAEAAAGWGLVGTWALDCRLPPSESNGHVTYVVTQGGRLAQERDFGSRRDANDVLRAEQAVGGLALTIYFPAAAQTRLVTFAKAADGRLRAIAEALPATNEFAIQDGKVAATGVDTPWQTRCR